MLIRKIIQMGNSLGVTIPTKLVEELGLKEGDEIQVERLNGMLRLIPVKRVPRIKPEDLPF